MKRELIQTVIKSVFKCRLISLTSSDMADWTRFLSIYIYFLFQPRFYWSVKICLLKTETFNIFLNQQIQQFWQILQNFTKPMLIFKMVFSFQVKLTQIYDSTVNFSTHNPKERFLTFSKFSVFFKIKHAVPFDMKDKINLL